MGTKDLFVLIHIRNKGEVGTVKHVKPSSNVLTDRFKGGASFVDTICYLCLSPIMSCLFLAAL